MVLNPGLRVPLATLLFVLSGGGCAGEAPRRAQQSVPVPAAVPSATPAALASPSGSAAVATPPLDPRLSFSCGSSRCRAGQESCCTLGDSAVCAVNAPADPPEWGQLLGTQIEQCKALPALGDVDGIARCRSSEHCAQQELCCDEFLFSGASAFVCKAAEGAELSCAYGEVCSEDLPCRGPGKVCAKGRCRKSASVTCGPAPCDLTTHTCHVLDAAKAKLECVADSEIEAWRTQGRPISSVDCVRHADCQPGELCRTALGRAFCQRADDGMSAVMCDQAGDCPKDLCQFAPAGSRKLACARAANHWHKICQCS